MSLHRPHQPLRRLLMGGPFLEPRLTPPPPLACPPWCQVPRQSRSGPCPLALFPGRQPWCLRALGLSVCLSPALGLLAQGPRGWRGPRREEGGSSGPLQTSALREAAGLGSPPDVQAVVWPQGMGCTCWPCPGWPGLPPRSLYPCPDPEPGTRVQPRALQNPGAFRPTRQGWGRQRPPAGLWAAAALAAGAVIWENQGWASFCQGFARPPSRGLVRACFPGAVVGRAPPRQEAPSCACRTAPPRLVSRAVWQGRPLLDVASWWPGAPPAGCVPGGPQSQT